MSALTLPGLMPTACAGGALARAAALLGLLVACALPARAGETLRVLTWPGYADPDLVQRFERENEVRVDVSYIHSDESLRKNLSGNGSANYDVFAANTAELQSYIQLGVAVPLQLANIPNRERQLPRFRDLARVPGIARAGKVYAVAYTYSEMGLIYDRKQFRSAPPSLAALWDPQYQGRVLAFDTSGHNFSIASMALGGHPFRIPDAQFRSVVQKLVALRRNVLTFYSQPEESVELFRKHKVALMFANYGSQQVKLLRDAGADVGYVVPQEGALAWLDCWAVTRGARNKALAERWINFMLEPQVSAELTRRQGLANTLQASATRENDKLLWLEPVEDEQRRAGYWARILSGDLPEKL
jgi:putative spermidine/putrescine transport system substrate-binding protein